MGSRPLAMLSRLSRFVWLSNSVAQVFPDSGSVLLIVGLVLHRKGIETLTSVCYFSPTFIDMAKASTTSSTAPCCVG